MNLFISQKKDIVKNYLKKVSEIKTKIADVKTRFTSEYAKSEIEKLKLEDLHNYETAKKMITDIFDEVKGYLSIASFPDVQELTSDRILFTESTGLDLSVNEVLGFVERYKNNPTMLRLIKTWLEKNHDGFNEYSEIKNAIHLSDDKLEVYRKFSQSAISLLDSIHNNLESIDKTDEVTVNAYADENFSKNLFNIIGDGSELKDYKFKKVPDSAKHIFDDINL